MISIADINAYSEDEFVRTFGDVAEHSPWVAEAAHAFAPFANREVLIGAFEKALRLAPKTKQLDLINAHPDLAGKAAVAGDMAEDSKKEQAGAGLDTLTCEEFARFTELNAAYKEKFGFPFILAVKGATKNMILSAFESRQDNSITTEFETALQQIARIFRFRLEDRVGF